MKKMIFLICALSLTANIKVVYAQSLLERTGNRVKDNVEQRIEDKAVEATDHILDESEEAIKESISGDEEETEKVNTGEKENDDEKVPTSTKNNKNQNAEKPATPQSKIETAYNKYDFVPGNEVIFEDDLKGEQVGEFPGRWNLIEGAAEIGQVNGENVITFVGYTYIAPLFKDNNFSLPDAFTLEFDFLVDGKEGENMVEIMNPTDEVIANSFFWKDNIRFIFDWNNNTTPRSSEDTYDNSLGWHHYALSFNKRAIKVYVDAKRVANIPNVTEKPVKLRFFARGSEDDDSFHIKNVRIAKGAVPLYDRLLSSGKIVTYGITFDVGKATIKPQSMGTINEIFSILKQYPDLKFSVEGHTDNTGNLALNQTLSEARSKAIVEKLVEMGIDKSRLASAGKGQNNPISDNSTPEGRAKNRRVEFVKL